EIANRRARFVSAARQCHANAIELSPPHGQIYHTGAMAASIFISYAQQDRARAEQFAARFAGAGWSVWWDRQTTGARHFDKAIEEAIAAAKVVVVLRSRASVA